jgi:hypothetical protein
MLGAAIELSDVELAKLNQIVEVAGAETAAAQTGDTQTGRP